MGQTMARTTMSAAAKKAGVSRQTASKARRTGRLVTDDDGMVEPAHAEAVLGQRRGRRAKPVPELAAERLRGERLKNEQRELDLAKARGELLPAVDVRRGLEVVYLTVRDRLRSIPMSIAALVVEAAHKPDAEQGVYRLMLDAIDEALTELGNAKMVGVDDDSPPSWAG